MRTAPGFMSRAGASASRATSGPREAGGWCRNGRCAGVDARAHVRDLATRAWALPLILAEGRFSSQKAKQRLEQLIKRMRSRAPEDRPSLFFSGVLISLSPLVLPRLRSDDCPGAYKTPSTRPSA